MIGQMFNVDNLDDDCIDEDATSIQNDSKVVTQKLLRESGASSFSASSNNSNGQNNNNNNNNGKLILGSIVEIIDQIWQRLFNSKAAVTNEMTDENESEIQEESKEESKHCM